MIFNRNVVDPYTRTSYGTQNAVVEAAFLRGKQYLVKISVKFTSIAVYVGCKVHSGDRLSELKLLTLWSSR